MELHTAYRLLAGTDREKLGGLVEKSMAPGASYNNGEFLSIGTHYRKSLLDIVLESCGIWHQPERPTDKVGNLLSIENNSRGCQWWNENMGDKKETSTWGGMT